MEIKDGKLKIYKVKEEYLNFLGKFDQNVRQEYERKYYGILVTENKIDYCIPFTCKIKKRSPKLTINIKNEGKIIAQLTMNNMIPVTSKVIEIVNIKDDKDKYYLYSELEFLKKGSVIKKLLDKAENIIKVTNNPKDKDYEFFRSLCCNFKLLEQKCKIWNEI